jgi:hypothetical protein
MPAAYDMANVRKTAPASGEISKFTPVVSYINVQSFC